MTALLACVLTTSAAAQTVSVSLPEGHEFTNPDRQPFALSPDGTRIAYLARATLFIKAVSGGEPTLVQGPLQGRGKTNPIFSPDGQTILYWAQDDSVLQRVPVRGGTPVTVAKVDNPFGLSWGGDGQVLVGAGAKGVLKVSAAGGAVTNVVTLRAGEAARSPQMLPGGDTVLFTLAEGTPTNWNQSHIVAQSISTGKRTMIADGRDARYVASGHLLFVSNSTLMAVAFDPRTSTATGQPVAIAPGVQTETTTGAALFSVAANGSVAFAPTGAVPIQLALVGLDGSRKVLGNVPAGTTAPRIAMDGKKVTFAAAGDIYVADIGDVNGARKVIANGTFPLFSPDGQWLAFGSLGTKREGGDEVLFMQRADGSGEAQMIVRPARAPEHWLPGDQGFTFITHRGGANNYDLWVYSPARKEVEPLVVVNETAQLSSSLSPDGKWVAYMSSESGDWQIYVQPYPTTGMKYQVTTRGGRSPMWASGGRLIYDEDGALMSVPVQLGATPAFGAPTPLPVSGYIQPLLRRNWDITPDLTQLLMLFRPGPRVEILSNWTSKLPARGTR